MNLEQEKKRKKHEDTSWNIALKKILYDIVGLYDFLLIFKLLIKRDAVVDCCQNPATLKS